MERIGGWWSLAQSRFSPGLSRQTKRKGDRQKGAPRSKQPHGNPPSYRRKLLFRVYPPRRKVKGPLFPLGRESGRGLAEEQGFWKQF